MKSYRIIIFQYLVLITILVCFSNGSNYFIRKKRSIQNRRIKDGHRKRYNQTKTPYSSYAYLSTLFGSLKPAEKKDHFDLMEFLKERDVPIKEDNKKSWECEVNLKKEDGNNWNCKIMYSTEINDLKQKKIVPEFCICEYFLSDNEKYHFSYDYMKQLYNENVRKKINRGADYQCENVLYERTSKNWICHVTKNVNNILNDPDEELSCDCKHQKIVDFYS
ncbi:unnamed protein product [Brachionus calyciflorus]|uniref:Uncharacterized protein n=1 Tax=Brachionus calyciflorus TaxID=104777 RepID=A0A813Z1I1_9BILA|nr:unnamed protein product [Brachionus calyciflorus]